MFYTATGSTLAAALYRALHFHSVDHPTCTSHEAGDCNDKVATTGYLLQRPNAATSLTLACLLRFAMSALGMQCDHNVRPTSQVNGIMSESHWPDFGAGSGRRDRLADVAEQTTNQLT